MTLVEQLGEKVIQIPVVNSSTLSRVVTSLFSIEGAPGMKSQAGNPHSCNVRLTTITRALPTLRLPIGRAHKKAHTHMAVVVDLLTLVAEAES